MELIADHAWHCIRGLQEESLQCAILHQCGTYSSQLVHSSA